MGNKHTLAALKARHVEDEGQLSPEEQQRRFRAAWEQVHGAPTAAPDDPEAPQPPREPTTAAEAVLVVARRFAGAFTLTNLVIRVWSQYPWWFSLPGSEGYPSVQGYPSDRRVYATLCGKRGWLAKGMIRSLGRGRYEVTEKGRQV